VDSGNVTRAIAEKDILQHIHHPFIVRLYFAFQSAEHLFLVMNYVGGGELYMLMESFSTFRNQVQCSH
jgi:serine/threonine protein kinase